MYPQNVRESARTLKGLFSLHYYHVTNSIPSISDWCWWMNSRKANVSVILNYPIKVQIWSLLPSRLLLSIIIIVTFVFSLVAGQKDLVSKLVWTPQTGNYHHHCPRSDHWWSKMIDNHHDDNLYTRPTPPHLTSVLAEQLLARACENEADNAKRMRMGMEPVSQVMFMAVTFMVKMIYI